MVPLACRSTSAARVGQASGMPSSRPSLLSGLQHPIVLAPMAGGPATPALAAAVSGAGGLGFLAAGYRTPEAVRDEIRTLRGQTDAPFGLNLFVPGGRPVDE